MVRKISVYLFFCLSACTIIPDDALDKLPEQVVVSGLEIRFRNETTGEQKVAPAKLNRSAQKIEINWPEDVDIFFYNKNVSKSVYQLNTAGFTEKITTTFIDGSEIVDEIVYDGSNRITQLKNSFFNDNLKFFYIGDQLDSIAKTRTLPGGSTQTGFYKRTDADKFVSIFPFNSGQAYSLFFSYIGECTCEATAPVANELNKTGYTYSNQDSPYYSGFYLETIYRQQIGSNYCNKTFSSTFSESNRNFFSKSNYRENYSFDCANPGKNYLSVFLLIPETVPDFLSVYLATVDSEVKRLNINPKTSDWVLGAYYTYSPL